MAWRLCTTTSPGYLTTEGFEKMKRTVPPISRDEGFSAHHEAMPAGPDKPRATVTHVRPVVSLPLNAMLESDALAPPLLVVASMIP